MRLFIAISSDQEEEYLARLQQNIKQNIKFPDAKLRFISSFHLTLKFLGEVQPEDAEQIKQKLRAISFNKFTLFFDSIGVFPSENYIRVVWLGLKPEDKAAELQNIIDEKLKGMFKKEKNFKPHITLARVKSVEDKKGFVRLLSSIKVEKRKINVNEFLLVQSQLKPTGTVYAVLERFSLL